MPVQTSTSTASVEVNNTVGKLKLRGGAAQTIPDAFPELDANGFCVVKGVISLDKAGEYVDRMYKRGGVFRLGLQGGRQGDLARQVFAFIQQEQWAWDMRTEPALIDVFAKIWGTEELLVSIDAIDLSLPFSKEEAGERAMPWPHVDQSPNRRFKHCIQGLVNLLPNGPFDGGLRVLEGSFKLYNEFFDTHADEMPEGGWSWRDTFHHSEKHMQWFYDRGWQWKKVGADPGDVILWDSRCIHYGASPEGDSPRLAIYVCYKPAKDIDEEHAGKRREAMEELAMTSHDPLLFRFVGVKGYGEDYPGEPSRPKVAPVLIHRAQQLAGIEAY